MREIAFKDVSNIQRRFKLLLKMSWFEKKYLKLWIKLNDRRI